jgi:hypothetical protein
MAEDSQNLLRMGRQSIGIKESLRGLLEVIIATSIKRCRWEITVNLRSRVDESLKMPADANIDSSMDHNSLKIKL